MAVGGWLAILAGVALVPFVVPLPEREDLPMFAAGALALVVGAVLLRAIGAPDWTIVVGAVGLAVLILAALDRKEAAQTGRIRVPPGYRFGSRKRYRLTGRHLLFRRGTSGASRPRQEHGGDASG